MITAQMLMIRVTTNYLNVSHQDDSLLLVDPG